jgi:3-phosphoshikimate 1-carboxyvinyltransferase
MTIRLEPAGPVRARLSVPGDKSISHRALILNALARGRSRVVNLAPGDDVVATIDALRTLGVRIDGVGAIPGGSGRYDAVLARIEGGEASWSAASAVDCRNAGTTARLLLGVLAPRAQGTVVLTGDASLTRRPMARVAEPLRAMGASIDERGESGCLPLAVSGRPLQGRAHRLEVASAQVKSAILLAGLVADGVTSVEEPARSRDHTERMLSAMGARLAHFDGDTPRVEIRSGPIDAIDVEVPGDLSSAAAFLALAAGREGSEIVIEDVGLNPTRAGFLSILRRMGATVETELEAAEPEPRGTLLVSGGPLAAVDVGPADVPAAIDELPLVAVLATQAQGVTRVHGAAELRVKESDRIASVAAGLQAMGARIETTADGFEVEGPTELTGAALDATGDHRIAMAFAVAALLARGPSRLSGAEWVAISYPDFFDDLASAAGIGIVA